MLNITRYKALLLSLFLTAFFFHILLIISSNLSRKVVNYYSEHDTILWCHGLKQIQRNVLMVFQMDSHLTASTLQCIGIPPVVFTTYTHNAYYMSANRISVSSTTFAMGYINFFLHVFNEVIIIFPLRS